MENSNGEKVFSKCHSHYTSPGLMQGKIFCNVTYDGLLCWPPTKENTFAVQPCFEQLNGVRYNTSDNVTKWCGEHGRWLEFTDYTKCRPIYLNMDDSDGITKITYVYLIGYTISMLTCSLAVFLFLYFKELRCLRNTIHTNLLVTYALSSLLWIISNLLQINNENSQMKTAACVTYTILHYFYLTNFFWMFIEGLYLYLLVIKTFFAKNVKLRYYMMIGWGCSLSYAYSYLSGAMHDQITSAPLFIILAWIVVRHLLHRSGGGDSSAREGLRPPKRDDDSCPYFEQQHADVITYVPSLLVLAANAGFLVAIMWVLIRKLRSANSVESQQYYKAARALLVLIPLLGITYIIVITGPSQGYGKLVFSVIQALLLSTQGLTVAVLYCFVNTEVRNTLKIRFRRWRDHRNLDPRRPCKVRFESTCVKGPSGEYISKHRLGSCSSDVTTAVTLRNDSSTHSESKAEAALIQDAGECKL